MEAAAEQHKPDEVQVTVGVTNEDDGTTQTLELTIPAGPTPVPALKVELGLPESGILWVVQKDGKRKTLTDNMTFNVKADDHFEAIVKGGVS